MAMLAIRTGEAGPTVEITREEDGTWTIELESVNKHYVWDGLTFDEVKALSAGLPAALGYAMVSGALDDA